MVVRALHGGAGRCIVMRGVAWWCGALLGGEGRCMLVRGVA